jgi:hypothetical protein
VKINVILSTPGHRVIVLPMITLLEQFANNLMKYNDTNKNILIINKNTKIKDSDISSHFEKSHGITIVTF